MFNPYLTNPYYPQPFNPSPRGDMCPWNVPSFNPYSQSQNALPMDTKYGITTSNAALDFSVASQCSQYVDAKRHSPICVKSESYPNYDVSPQNGYILMNSVSPPNGYTSNSSTSPPSGYAPHAPISQHNGYISNIPPNRLNSNSPPNSYIGPSSASPQHINSSLSNSSPLLNHTPLSDINSLSDFSSHSNASQLSNHHSSPESNISPQNNTSPQSNVITSSHTNQHRVINTFNAYPTDGCYNDTFSPTNSHSSCEIKPLHNPTFFSDSASSNSSPETPGHLTSSKCSSREYGSRNAAKCVTSFPISYPPLRDPASWITAPSVTPRATEPPHPDTAVSPPYEWSNPQARRHTNNLGKTRTKDKYRVVYTDTQRLELEKEFQYSRYVTIRGKGLLATRLGLSERQVKIWFQNRRAKERKLNKKLEITMATDDMVTDALSTNTVTIATDMMTANDMAAEVLTSELNIKPVSMATDPCRMSPIDMTPSVNLVSSINLTSPTPCKQLYARPYNMTPPLHLISLNTDSYLSSI